MAKKTEEAKPKAAKKSSAESKSKKDAESKPKTAKKSSAEKKSKPEPKAKKVKDDEEDDEDEELDLDGEDEEEDIEEDLDEIADDMLADESEDEGKRTDNEIAQMLRETECAFCSGSSSKFKCKVRNQFGCPDDKKDK